MAFTDYLEIEYGTVFPGSNLTDYPLLIVIAGDSDIAAELAGGGGLKVTSGDGSTDYSFGLYPSSDPASGDLILRVKIPSLLTSASTGDPLCRIYVDSGETTVEDKAGVVSNGYTLFAVAGDYGSGNIVENWVTGTLYAGSGGLSNSDLEPGTIDQQLDFDGNDYVDLGSDASLRPTGSMTLEAWAELGHHVSNQHIISNDGNSGAFGFSLTRVAVSGSLDRWDFKIASSSTAGVTIQSNTYTGGSGGMYYVVGIYDAAATSMNLLINAVSEATSGSAPASQFNQSAFGNPKIGGRGQGTAGAFTGAIGDVRQSNVARSTDWIEFAKENDSNNANTWQKGDFVTGSPPAGGNRRRRLIICGAAA